MLRKWKIPTPQFLITSDGTYIRYGSALIEFFEQCREQPDYWERISQKSLARIENRYTWKLYAERMMTLARIYGFWKFVTKLEREETCRYFDIFYSLQFRRLCEKFTAPGSR